MIASHAIAMFLSLSPATGVDPPSPGTVRGAILRANRAYERQNFDEAIHVYATIPPTPDRPAAICFNEGLAFAGMGDAGRAAQSFRMADLNATDNTLRANARFNLARLRYDGAMELAQTEPERAIEELREAARTFRAVLDVDPADAEAAKNVERTRLAIRAIQEQLRREAEERQQRQSQMNEMAQQLQQLAERQRQAADQSQQAEQQMQQDSAVGAEASRQSQANQRPISEETQEMMQKLSEMLQNMPGNDPSQTDVSESLGRMDDARQEQGEAEEELSETRPGEAAGDQREAADLLEEAARQLAEAAKGDGEGDQPGQQPRPGQEPGDGENEQDQPTEGPPREVKELGRADGDPIARRLLEKEIMDRVNRVRRGPPIPTERDW